MIYHTVFGSLEYRDSDYQLSKSYSVTKKGLNAVKATE